MASEYSFFTSGTLRRKERRDRQNVITSLASGNHSEILDALFEQAGLGEREMKIAQAVRVGFSFDEIGVLLGVSRRTAFRHYHAKVLPKLRKAVEHNRTVHARQAFIASQQVAMIDAHRHCSEGNEKCRKLGYCPFRSSVTA